MTAAAEHVVEDFEALPETEKRQALAKILQIASQMDYGPITDEELESMTDAVFVMYDAEERSE